MYIILRSLLVFLLATLSYQHSAAQSLYDKKFWDFDGIEYKTFVEVKENPKGEIYSEITIKDNNGSIKLVTKIKYEDYDQKFWLKEPLSFYNSIGLVQFKDGGDYYYDFLTQKKVLYFETPRRNSHSFGHYISVINSNTNYVKKTTNDYIAVYDRNLNLIRKIGLPKRRIDQGEYYHSSSFINNKSGKEIFSDLSEGEVFFSDHTTAIIGYNAKENYFFNPATKAKITYGQSNSGTGFCPDNFKEISNNEVSGTARKYKATNGKYYYEVKLTISPNVNTKRYTTKIEAERIQESKNVEIGLMKTVNVIAGSSGTFTFKGCFETDKFEIEAFYSCKTGRFSGPSATVNFRDLKIIQ